MALLVPMEEQVMHVFQLSNDQPSIPMQVVRAWVHKRLCASQQPQSYPGSQEAPPSWRSLSMTLIWWVSMLAFMW